MNIIIWYGQKRYTKSSKQVCLVSHSIFIEAIQFYLPFEHT